MTFHPFRHLGLKLLSVALALLIWLSVSGEQIVERSLRVPLELQNIPERLDIIESPPAAVDVRVRGGSGLLSHLSPGDVVVVVDLSSARTGRRFIPLTLDLVHTPVGVQVTQVTPSMIPLEFERFGTRTVHIAPTVEGQPAQGYAIHSVTAQPSNAEVSGPDTALRLLQKVMTEPVSIAGATGPVRETVTLGVSTPGLRLNSPSRANVTVDIRPQTIDRQVPGVVVRSRNVPPGRTAQMTPSNVSITVRGAEAALRDLTPQRFAAFVDLARLAPGRYNLQIQVELPPNVEIVRIDPPNVSVRLK